MNPSGALLPKHVSHNQFRCVWRRLQYTTDARQDHSCCQWYARRKAGYGESPSGSQGVCAEWLDLPGRANCQPTRCVCHHGFGRLFASPGRRTWPVVGLGPAPCATIDETTRTRRIVAGPVLKSNRETPVMGVHPASGVSALIVGSRPVKCWAEPSPGNAPCPALSASESASLPSFTSGMPPADADCG